MQQRLQQLTLIYGSVLVCILVLQGCGCKKPPSPITCEVPEVSIPCGDAPKVGIGLSTKYQSKCGTDPRTAASKLRGMGVSSVRIFDYDKATLQALLDHGIKDVYITVPNDEVGQIAKPNWLTGDKGKLIAETVHSFHKKGMRFIVGVGNEPTAPWEKASLSAFLPEALDNLHKALIDLGLAQKVQLSVPFDYGIMHNTYPPQEGRFGGPHLNIAKQTIAKLHETNGVFTINIYPWFAWKNDPNIYLELALGKTGNAVDGRPYRSLLHQQIVSVRSALVSLRPEYVNMPIVVGETGWPSDSSGGATRDNQCMYAQGVLGSASSMDANLRTIYLFAGFDESTKSLYGHGGGHRGEENHFGLFYEAAPKYTQLHFPKTACDAHSLALSTNTSGMHII